MIRIDDKKDFKNLIINAYNSMNNEEYEIFCDNFNKKFDYSGIKHMDNLFQNTKMKKIPELNLINVLDVSFMFASSEIEQVNLLNTYNIIRMESVFNNCKSLKEINDLDLKNTTMLDSAFKNCLSLEKIVKAFSQEIRDLSKSS